MIKIIKNRLYNVCNRYSNMISESVVDRVSKLIVDRIPKQKICFPFSSQDTHFFTHSCDGHRLFLEASDLHISLHVLENGCWEDHVRAVMRRVLKPGATFVDVGANVGLHTLFAASLVGATGHVHAFEPLPLTFNTLRTNIDINGLNGYTKAYQLAVGERKEQKTFERFGSHTGLSGFMISKETLACFGETGEAHEQSSVERLTVDVTTLDKHLSGHKVDAIKVDVEGFEALVLRGAENLIKKNRDICLILEWDPKVISRAMGENTITQSIDYLSKEDFEPYISSSTQDLIRTSWDDPRLRGAGFDLVVSRNILC